MNKSFTHVVPFLFLNLFLISVVFITSAQETEKVLVGNLSIIPLEAEEREPSRFLTYITTYDQELIPIQIDEKLLQAAGGVHSLNSKRVEVTLSVNFNSSELSRAISVRLVDLGTQNTNHIAPGTHTWVTIPCKFSDVSAEPQPQSYIDNLFDDIFPRLANYWKVTSYNKTIITDVQTLNWQVLPKTRDYYLSLPVNTRFIELYEDCTATADDQINYQEHFGINMVFNDFEDSSYFNFGLGGQLCTTLDNEYRCRALTWLVVQGIKDVAWVAHEMGHAYGLYHSNNGDSDNNPYDNVWDVMSNWIYGCSYPPPQFGCRPMHTIAHHKDQLGWIDPNKKFAVASPGSYTLLLDHLAKPNTENYHIIVVPVSDNRWFTIEARQNDNSDYDVHLPNSGVLIHEIDTTRLEPAWLVGASSDVTTSAFSGLWVVGETYTNYLENFSVAIDNETVDGYQVTIQKGQLPNTPPDLTLQISGEASKNASEGIFTLIVTNNGLGSANGVTLSSEFRDTKLRFFSTLPSDKCQGVVDVYRRTTLICAIGTLGVGESFTTTVTAKATETGTVNFRGTVIANQTDANFVDNQNEANLSLTAAPDLSVVVESPSQNVQIGQEVSFILKHQNLGGIAANNASFTLYLPVNNLEFVDFQFIESNCFVEDLTYVWEPPYDTLTYNYGKIQSGAECSWLLSMKGDVEGTDTISLSAVMDETDPNLADNSITQQISVSDDPIALTPTPSATETPDTSIELLLNGGFELNNTDWTAKNATSDKRKCNKPGKIIARTGDCAFQFKGGAGENSKLEQRPAPTAITTGDTITLSGFYRATGAVNAKVKVTVKYTNTTLAKGKINLNLSASSDYTAFTGDLAEVIAGEVASIKVALQNKSTSGKVLFDDLSLQLSEDSAGLMPLPQ
jgi:uncharacterized repeat protein (TIGR01451 family)